MTAALHVGIDVAALVTSVLAAWRVWQHSRSHTKRWLAALLLATGAYFGAWLAEMAMLTPADKVVWNQLEQTLIAINVAILPIFAMHAAGRRPRYAVIYVVVPVLAIMLTWTNNWHHLMWEEWFLDPTTRVLRGDYNIGFWLFSFYSFSAVLFSLFYLMILRPSLPTPQRHQVTVFVTSLLLIAIGTLLYVVRAWPSTWPHLGHLGALMNSVMLLWWTRPGSRTPLFIDFTPVDRSHLLEAFPYATLVLNPHGDVVDVNTKMSRLLERPITALLGQRMETALADWPEFLTFCRESLGRPTSFSRELTRHHRVYEVHSVPIGLPNQQRLGRAVSLYEITHRKELERSLAQQARHYETLYRLSERLVGLLDPQAVCREVVQAVAVTLGYAYAGIFLLDEKTGERVLVASHGWGEDLEGWRLAPGEGVSDRAIREKRLQYTPDVTQDPQYVPGVGTGAEVDVPLLVDDRVLGVLVVESETPHAFSEEDLRTLTAVAHLTAQALERCHLFQRTQQQAHNLRLLQDILLALNADPHIDASFPQVAEYLKAFTGAARISIALRNPDGQTFSIVLLSDNDQALGFQATLPISATSAAADVLAGRVHITPDLRDEQDTPGERALLQAGYRSRVNVPMRVGGRVIGALNLVWRYPDGCRPEYLPVLQQVAEAMALAYERSRLLREVDRRARELRIVYDMALTLSAARSVSEVLARLNEHLTHTMQPDAIGVFTYLPEQEALLVVEAVEDGQPVTEILGRTFPLDEAGLTGWVARHRESLLVGDLTRDTTPVPPRQVTDPPTRAWLGVPLLLGDRLVGVITVQAHRADVFDEEDKHLLETLAPSIALALENARLYETAEQARTRAERLFQAAQALSATLDLQEVLARILSELRSVVPYDSASVQELHGDTLVIIGGHGFPNLDEIVGLTFRVDDPTSPNGEVIRHRRPLIVGNAWERFAKFREAPHAPASIHSWLGVPMLYGDQVIGMITLDKREPNFYTEADAQVALAFAQQAAIAIVNARLYAAAQRRAAYQAALNTILARVSTAPSPDILCQDVLVPLRDTLHATAACLILGEKVHALGVEAKALRDLTADLLTLPHWVCVPSPDATALPPRLAAFLEQSGFRSILGVRLTWDKGPPGFLALFRRDAEPWDEEARALLQAVVPPLQTAIERLRLLEAVREQAARLEQILTTMPEGVLLLDADHRLVLANPQARAWFDLFHLREGARVERLGALEAQTLLTPVAAGIWYTTQTDTTPPRFFEVVAQPIGDAHTPRGWVLLLRDVTREREVEARIQQHERLAAVGRLAAGIAHDFNNILQGMTGFAQLLARREDLPEDVRSRLQHIATYGQRGTRLIRQLLDFSRSSPSHFQPCDLRDVVRDTLAWLTETLPQHIEVVQDLTDTPCPLLADPVQLEQVLVNLVLNARDAMPNGGRLTVRVTRLTVPEGDTPPVPELRPGAWAVLEVSDTGVGIPDDVLPHIFEPFFTTKDVDEGVGLGLAQVYGIVRQHRGAIDVTSAVGRGTTFRVYLPLQEESLPERPVPPTRPVALIWSPHPDVQRHLRSMLLLMDYTPILVNLAAKRSWAFGQEAAVLILDLTTPNAWRLFLEHRERLCTLYGGPCVVLVGAQTPPEVGRELPTALRLPWPAGPEALKESLKRAVQEAPTHLASETPHS